MTPRTRRRGPARCPDCHRPVRWLGSPHSGRWRTFDPSPVDAGSQHAADAYPVEGVRAWRVRDLVEDLMVRRRCSEATARDEVYAMPWYVLHICPPEQEPE